MFRFIFNFKYLDYFSLSFLCRFSTAVCSSKYNTISPLKKEKSRRRISQNDRKSSTIFVFSFTLPLGRKSINSKLTCVRVRGRLFFSILFFFPTNKIGHTACCCFIKSTHPSKSIKIVFHRICIRKNQTNAAEFRCRPKELPQQSAQDFQKKTYRTWYSRQQAELEGRSHTFSYVYEEEGEHSHHSGHTKQNKSTEEIPPFKRPALPALPWVQAKRSPRPPGTAAHE